MERNIRERCRENLPLVTDLMVDDTKAACSRRSGELAESIGADPWVDAGDRFTSSIFATAEHARYQDEGTGLFGPEGQRIYPTSGKVLAFDWPAAGGTVFFASVAGSPGTHFWSGPDGQEMARRYSAAISAAFA